MSDILLENTRKIHNLIHNSLSRLLIFSDICKCVGDILHANVLVVSQKGKVLGNYKYDSIPCFEGLTSLNIGDFIDKGINEELLKIESNSVDAVITGFSSIVMPIDLSGMRAGTSIIYRSDKPFEVDDIVLSEYMSTVIDLEMTRAIHKEQENERILGAATLSACDMLSVSEKEAIRLVMAELPDDEGIIVASKISGQHGLTRSIIVNAIKKLKGAGVLDSKSLGMKGTYVKFYNKTLVNETLEKVAE